jgi:hypothetical protein
VEFDDPNVADRAMATLNGRHIHGKVLMAMGYSEMVL